MANLLLLPLQLQDDQNCYCILKLAEKYESTKSEAIKRQTKDLKVSDLNGYEEVHFPTKREVKIMDDQYVLGMGAIQWQWDISSKTTTKYYLYMKEMG